MHVHHAKRVHQHADAVDQRPPFPPLETEVIKIQSFGQNISGKQVLTFRWRLSQWAVLSQNSVKITIAAMI